MNMAKLVKKICILTTIIVLLAIALLPLYCRAEQKNEIQRKQNPVIIYYIPGWKNKGKSQEERVSLLQKIYPCSEVLVKEWESDDDFETCKNRADEYVVKSLTEEICAMSQEEQRNLILIGHSLGGRIAVKTIARLKNKNVFIRKGVFLGAAIPDDAPEIEQAITSTIEPCINVHNKNDYVLRRVYIIGDGLRDALGSYGYSKAFYGVHLLQFEIKSSETSAVSWVDKYITKPIKKMQNHYVDNYLTKLSEIEEAIRKYYPGGSTFSLRTRPPDGLWTVDEECCNWKIHVQEKTPSSYIENQYGNVVFCGNREDAMNYWKQLSTKYTQTAQEEIDKIQVLQDEENPVMKVIPSELWGWENVDTINDWRLQRKKKWFREMIYRIIDPKDFQRANGSEQKMRESFDSIKKQLLKK